MCALFHIAVHPVFSTEGRSLNGYRSYLFEICPSNAAADMPSAGMTIAFIQAGRHTDASVSRATDALVSRND